VTASLISVIIPAYNCEPYLRRAVQSLLATRYPRLEIVIVDDGSRDGTWRVAADLHEQYPDSVVAFRHPEGKNCGVSASRNLGIGRSNGQLIAFLDADDYVYPCRFDSAVDILRRCPNVDAVHQLARMEFADVTAQSTWVSDEEFFGLIDEIAEDHLLSTLLGGTPWPTSAIVCRRSLLERTGLFDTRFRIAEDCHLWMRMAWCGRVVAGDMSQPVSVYWRRNDSAYQASPFQRVHMIRAMADFYRWARRRDPEDPRLATVRRCVGNYILTGIIEARSQHQLKLGWTLAWHSLWSFPAILLRRQFPGNVVRMALGLQLAPPNFRKGGVKVRSESEE
jgi:glycosyltransferase involved in cell wall biosynthesis